MTKSTLRNISILSILLSLITLILSIYFKSITWYENKACTGYCNTFSITSLTLIIFGFIMGMVFLTIISRNTDIKGKSIIRRATLLHLIIFFIWLMNYFGIFLNGS
ncbi:MAG TPA: hypothetical protein VJH37_05215 [Candidatus Nanoarchaeia archaeon]|nr:hypothetical protein [Candidatus Nanoarchaeia archaeon]